jgi:methionine-rich copper-binding protein CopC
MMRLLVATAAIPIVVAVAHAHAFLSQAVPPVGVVVSASPPEIRLKFTQEIEPAFSGAELPTAEGQPIAAGPATTNPRDKMELVMRLPLLAPGRYKVRWHVVSVDTHRTEGDYSFEIRP